MYLYVGNLTGTKNFTLLPLLQTLTINTDNIFSKLGADWPFFLYTSQQRNIVPALKLSLRSFVSRPQTPSRMLSYSTFQTNDFLLLK